MSVRMEQLGSRWKNFDIWLYFKYVSKNLKFYWNQARITGTLHTDQYSDTSANEDNSFRNHIR